MAQRTIEFAEDWLTERFDDGSQRGNHDWTQSVMAIREELARLRRIEQVAQEWADLRVQDGHIMGKSVIPSAQRLLDALSAPAPQL